MPPKKNSSSDSDASSTPDPIADATSAIFDESDASRTHDDADSRSSENAEVRNSTIPQSRNSADEGDETSSTEKSTMAEDDDGTTRQERIPGPYVPAEVAYALQEAQVQLRRLTGDKISQSLIIQCALEICIQDFQQRKDESGLAKLVAQRYRQKTK